MRRAVIVPFMLAAALFGAFPSAASEGAPCAEPPRGFIVASLCLALPLGAPAATATRVADLERAGIRVGEVLTGEGSLYVEDGIGTADRRTISAAQDRDIRALELDFARLFDPPPTVYVFAVPGTFELGMIVLFRITPAAARAVAGGHGGALDVATVSVALDWHTVRLERPVTIIRHELTHAMVHQIAGRDAELPAWLDEGLAAMSRDGVTAVGDAEADLAVTAALLADSRAALARLSTTESWLRQSGALGARSYSVARTAADLLTKDIGRSGIVALLERTAAGESFADAFFAVTGGTVGAFEAGFAGRIGPLALPARITTQPGNGTGDLLWSARGFPPASTASVTIHGGAYRLSYAVTLDDLGAFSAAFGSTAPAGSYTVTVIAAGVSASASFWSSGVGGDTTAHVRPWGTIAR